MDATGVPVVRSEIEGRTGKIEGQPTHTRDAKPGCVFTQTTTDDRGLPVHEEHSTTYTGAIQTAETFGRCLHAEAQNRGWSRAKRRVVIGDPKPGRNYTVRGSLGFSEEKGAVERVGCAGGDPLGMGKHSSCLPLRGLGFHAPIDFIRPRQALL